MTHYRMLRTWDIVLETALLMATFTVGYLIGAVSVRLFT